MKKLLILLVLIITAGFTSCEDTNITPGGENTYTVSFNANGGSGGPQPVKAAFGKAMPAITVTPQKAANTFNGYFDAKTGGKKYYNNDLSSAANWDKKANAVLYAQWTPIPAGSSSVSFNANGGSGGQAAPVIAASGQAMPAITEAPVNEGNTGVYAAGENAAGYYNVITSGSGTGSGVYYPVSYPSESNNYYVKKYFDGYWDAQTGGKKYYNADLTSATNWDKNESPTYTLYARWLTAAEKYNITLGNDDFVAYFVDTPPTIDGNGSDQAWAKARWQPMKYQWMYNTSNTTDYLTAASSAADFSGRFKVVWTADRLYILAEIIDDAIKVTRYNTYGGYNQAHNDDCLEIFFDENASGGTRASDGGNNFFTYHMGYMEGYHFAADYVGNPDNNVADIALKVLNGMILRDVHLNYVIVKNNPGGGDIWEIEMKVYDNTYPLRETPGMPSNASGGDPSKSEVTPVALTEGKKMGLAVAYCDSDTGVSSNLNGTNVRNHFFGSMAVTGATDNDRNQSYLNSTQYAKIYLVK
jgi:hypothetical protein